MEEFKMSTPLNKKVKIRNIVTVAVLVFVMVVALITVSLRLFVFERYHVNNFSMTPTISDGDWLWANKLKKPKRFDVVSIDAESYKIRVEEVTGKPLDDAAKIFLKRIVGVAGDTVSVTQDKWLRIESADGTVTVLDDEDYGGGKLGPLSYWLGYGHDFTKTLTVAEGYVFVLGDLRGSLDGFVSIDSRAFGLVALKDVIAVII